MKKVFLLLISLLGVASAQFGGASGAANSVDSTKILDGAITSTKIKNGDVQHWDLSQAVKDSLIAKGYPTHIGTSNFVFTKVDTIFTATFVPRWIRFTSGSKVWFAQVYAAADTTGKW